jgi:N-acetylmuramoyl-L-alanine amidase
MIRKFFVAFCVLFFLSAGFAQKKTPVEVLGKKKGGALTFSENGRTYVAARQMAKSLKLKTNWFGKSGQLDISAGGYFAVLRGGSRYVSVNGKKASLPAAAIIRKGKLFAPAEFFEGGLFAGALQYDISCAGNKIVIGRYDESSRLSSAAPPAPEEEDVSEIPAIESAPDERETEIKAYAPVIIPSIEKAASKKNRKMRVMIDAGHGDKDAGAVRYGIKEKDINLKVAKQLADLLKKESSVEVAMTRSGDVFIPLGKRAKMANDFKADIFVSIHVNAAPRRSASGFEVYFRSDKASDEEAAATAALENEALNYEGRGESRVSFVDLLLKSLAVNEYMNESSKLAGHIRNAVSRNQGSLGVKVFDGSGIKQANFYVLKGVEAPSILIELGYLSNSGDRKKLVSPAVHKKYALYIKDGIMSYARAEGWRG